MELSYNPLPSKQQVLVNTIVHAGLACEICSNECLADKETKTLFRCIRLSRDCADICFVAARLLRRHSDIAYEYLTVCEEICRICAAECMKHSHLEYCLECADACLKGAEACAENNAIAKFQHV